MANEKTAKLQATIDAWAKGQKGLEDATEKLADARAAVAPHAKAIYEAMGTKPFTVKALGNRKYRALHKPERKNEKTGNTSKATYAVIPVPEFEAEQAF